MNYIAKYKNKNSNDRKPYLNEANENLKNSLDHTDNIRQIKECTIFLYEESTKIRWFW